MTPIVTEFFSTRLPNSAYGDQRVFDVAKTLKKKVDEVAFEVSSYVLKQFALSDTGPFSEGSKLNKTYLYVKDLYLSVVNQLLKGKALQADELVRKRLKKYSVYKNETEVLEKLKRDAILAHDDLLTFPGIYKLGEYQEIDPFEEGVDERILNKYIVLFGSDERPIYFRELEEPTREYVYQRTMERLQEVLELAIPDPVEDLLREIYISEGPRRQLVYFLACPTRVQTNEPLTLQIFRKAFLLKIRISEENRQAVFNWLLKEMENLPQEWNVLEYRDEDIEKVVQLQTVLTEEVDPRGMSFYFRLKHYKNIDELLELSQSPYFEPEFENIDKFLKATLNPVQEVVDYFEESGIKGTSPELLTLAQMDVRGHLNTLRMLREEWDIQLNVAEAIAILSNSVHSKGEEKIREYIKGYPSEAKKEVYMGPMPSQVFGNWEHAKRVLARYQERYKLGDVEFIRLCLSYIATEYDPLSVIVEMEKFTEKELSQEHFLAIMHKSFNTRMILSIIQSLNPQDRKEDQEKVLAKIPQLLFLEEPNSPLVDAIITPLQERIEEIHAEPVS